MPHQGASTRHQNTAATQVAYCQRSTAYQVWSAACLVWVDESPWGPRRQDPADCARPRCATSASFGPTGDPTQNSSDPVRSNITGPVREAPATAQSPGRCSAGRPGQTLERPRARDSACHRMRSSATIVRIAEQLAEMAESSLQIRRWRVV